MTEKMSHKAANYRVADSILKRCGTCSMYRDSNPPSCTLVARPIRPSMICNYYERKASQHAVGKAS
jgi:hypothetical protein